MTVRGPWRGPRAAITRSALLALVRAIVSPLLSTIRTRRSGGAAAASRLHPPGRARARPRRVRDRTQRPRPRLALAAPHTHEDAVERLNRQGDHEPGTDEQPAPEEHGQPLRQSEYQRPPEISDAEYRRRYWEERGVERGEITPQEAFAAQAARANRKRGTRVFSISLPRPAEALYGSTAGKPKLGNVLPWSEISSKVS
jgi:hypothetical protein